MILLRLFAAWEPTREIDRRILAQGELTLGRDLGCEWVIDDPSATLSRRHCVLALGPDGGLTLRDESTNGVAVDGARAPMREAAPVAVGSVLMLGGFLIRVEALAAEPDTAPPLGEAVDPAEAGRLLEAFCAGAGIDPSMFAGEDPGEVMRRAGALYREMVQGMGELMTERTRAKVALKLERTTIQAIDNNPFRWAPPPRIAVDLLKPHQDGFLGGEAAVRSSFDDLVSHQTGLVAGSRAAVEDVLETLSPDAIAQALKGKPFLANRAGALWSEYVQAHEQACEALDKGGDAAGSAFSYGYEAAAAAARRA